LLLRLGCATRGFASFCGYTFQGIGCELKELGLQPYGGRPAQQSRTGKKGQDATGGEAAVLQAQLDGLKTQVDMMREQLDDLREQRDKWSDQAQTAQRMLTDSRPQKRGWFGFRKAG
jgi:hypothetical protein